MDAIIGAPGTGYRETSGEENRRMDEPDPPLGVGSSARLMLEKATDPAAFLHVRHLPRGQPSTAHLRSRTPRGAQRQLSPFKENLSTLTDTCKETGSDQRVRGGYDLTAVSPQPQRGGASWHEHEEDRKRSDPTCVRDRRGAAARRTRDRRRPGLDEPPAGTRSRVLGERGREDRSRALRRQNAVGQPGRGLSHRSASVVGRTESSTSPSTDGAVE